MAIKPLELDAVTYEEYCAALAHMMGQELSFSLPGPLMKWIEEAKDLFKQIADEIGASVMDLIAMFRHKDIFMLMKGVGFSLAKIMKALAKLPSLITKGLLAVMHTIIASGILDKLKSGAMTVDALLNKYPILKMLVGPALAGLLLYMWLNMSFIGDFSYDFDMGTIIDAFKGAFTLHDLFLTPEGLAMLALFAVGSFTGLSVAWLGENTLNLLIALLYTGAVRLHKSGVVNALKSMVQKKRYAL